MFFKICVAIFISCFSLMANDLLEAKVKTAYIYNFTKFVEWSNLNGKLKICIVGDDNIYNLLSEISQNSSFELFKNFEIAYSNCNIIYIGANQSNQKEILDSVINYEILTIGEIDDFLEKGGVIELFRDGAKVKFNINLAQAKHANLKISSKLLELAKNVKK